MFGAKGILIDGILEIEGFNPSTDKLVINQFGWMDSEYGDNQSENPIRLSKGLFPLKHEGKSMIIKSIDWYRDDVLITDPSSILSNIKGVDSFAGKKENKKYSLSGTAVKDGYSGIIIENGKKYIK